MRAVFCDRCREPINESGGIAFVRATAIRPRKGGGGVGKYEHDLCRPCFIDYLIWLNHRPWEDNPDRAAPIGPTATNPGGPTPTDRNDGGPTEGADRAADASPTAKMST